MVPRDYVDEVISSLFEDAVDPKISVVGVGGAGGKMVSALYDREIKGVETVAVNTDPAGLSKAECDVKILLPHSEDEDRVVAARVSRSEEHTSELQSHSDIVCRLLLEKKKTQKDRENSMRLSDRTNTSSRRQDVTNNGV